MRKENVWCNCRREKSFKHLPSSPSATKLDVWFSHVVMSSYFFPRGCSNELIGSILDTMPYRLRRAGTTSLPRRRMSSQSLSLPKIPKSNHKKMMRTENNEIERESAGVALRCLGGFRIARAWYDRGHGSVHYQFRILATVVDVSTK